MDYDNVEIIYQANNNLKLQVKELLHTLKFKPDINNQLFQQKFSSPFNACLAFPVWWEKAFGCFCAPFAAEIHSAYRSC